MLAGGQESRVADMLLAGHRGEWLLPIWPDVQHVGSPVETGDELVSCRTAGFDFASGGRALLYADLHRWEVVSVSAIESDHLLLSSPVTGAFARGARLLPLRRGWVRDGSEAVMLTDRVSRRTLEVDIAEPCDWPVLAGGAEYLGTRVLDVRPDASDDPSHAYAGLRESVDFGIAMPVVADLPGITLRTQRDSWKLFGRSEHSWFRSLLYSLRGRQRRIWVPSWCDDLRPALPIAAGSASVAIEWAGYTHFALGRPNRRDIRIQLLDGTVYYRRIIDSLDAGSIEILTLDAALDGAGISVHQIRQVSFLSMAALASDATEINHLTDADGTARATTGWQAVVPDV
ncbi:hypothetical protein CMZ84_04220 [Lysobacteraceae bacterium NML93-0399]|nr:hypothetical protein CMZ84_04220 [Xanthomonadaceae bacterium NML93-0399]